MRWLPLAASALCCAAAYSQSMTGKWVGSASPYDNGLEMVVALDQAADGTLTGYTQGGRFNGTITGGKVEGGKFTLDADRPARGGGAPQKVTFTGASEKGRMKLPMPAFRGRGPGRGPGPGAGAPPPGGGR